jgi:ABC-2 type transport system ATP-binding protein
MTTPFLEVADLRKSFGSTHALNGLTLEVQQGELFGLLGPNGAGKTTLLSIVAELLHPDSGSILFLDKPMRRERRHLFGIVPQDLAIYNELTARENMRFFGQIYGMGGPALERDIDEILEKIGLRDHADDRAGTFSGGMKRRLNLGASLVHKPRLLLLDEPTAGVDPQSRNHIFEEVRRLNAAGMTIVYTSHYMEEVQALCTRVGILDHGVLIACDTLANLLRQLPGVIRLRLANHATSLNKKLSELPGARLVKWELPTVELECADVKTVLLDVVATLNDEQVHLTSLETEEPNLERVFLHLTGRGLRD